MKCPKCSGEMEEGMVKCRSGYTGKEEWGKEIGWMGLMKNGKPVVTHRCSKCGYLESYAK